MESLQAMSNLVGMESTWCNVIKAGQQVNVKVKEGFMSVEVEKVLFEAKLASTGSYFMLQLG